jgi:hypothetical protein
VARPVIGSTFALLVVAGFGIARATTTASCRAQRRRPPRSLTVVVEDSVGPGGYVAGDAGVCGRVWLSVEAGRAPAGARVIAAGDVARTQRGVLIDHASITLRAGRAARSVATSGRSRDRPNLRRRRGARARAAHRGPE